MNRGESSSQDAVAVRQPASSATRQIKGWLCVRHRSPIPPTVIAHKLAIISPRLTQIHPESPLQTEFWASPPLQHPPI